MRTLPDYADIARLEEARLALGVGEVADESRPFAGGTMSRAAPGAWPNSAMGVGLAGAISRDEVRAMAAFYEEKGIEPRVELSPFADPSLVAALAEERFTVRFFENVFFRPLARGEAVRPEHEPPRALTIDAVDPTDAAEVDEYARVALSGFIPHDAPVLDEYLEVVRRVARHPRTTPVAARLDGRMVGAGAVEVMGEISALFGVSVLPEARRKGVQQAMMAWRLAFAAGRGARLATISSRPRVATERNARKLGFELAYTKVILVRPGEGLKPVVE